ncbi:MAG: hypothetical protein CVV47_10895 [Spirochaetae bacterium HGW-Spirochaetae-3]|nr:MAG: hypothetical protein CVV47_10895 [Spirochaetae bacterium HGW-Spirochaetae-3]
MRLGALAILVLLVCATTAWGMGGREDPIAYADVLIADQKYDEAILYLTVFMKKYPDRFDAAQKKLRQITRLRAAYNDKADKLIEVLKNQPEEQELKLSLIRDLEKLERNPNPAVKDFIAETKDLALFTYNKARFERFMAEGRALIDAGSFVEAARRYESGFDIYRPEFIEAGLDQAFVEAAFQRVASVSAAIPVFAADEAEMKAAFDALSAAYSSGAAIDEALARARTAAAATAETRRLVVDQGRALEATFAELSANDATVTENSFLPFAYRFVLGRRTEGQLEGIAGAIDAMWNASLRGAQTAIEDKLTASMETARAAYDDGDWAAATAGFSAAAESADRGVALLALWSHYAPSDLVERSTTLGQAVIELKGTDYLRFVHAGRAARTYGSLSTAMASMAVDEEALASYRPRPDAADEAFSTYEASRLAFVGSQNAIETIRDESGGTATRMADWSRAGFVSEAAQSEQGALDGRIANAADRARSMETLAVASAASFRYGLLSAAAERAIAAIGSGRELLDGLPSDDPLLPDATFYYPGKALSSLSSADAILKALRADIDSFLASIRSRPAYVASDASILEWAERARALEAAAAASQTEAAALTVKASEQKRLADSSRLEAERRVAESRTALRSNNFESARERLDRARERYLASLSFEQDAPLRAQSDRLLSELAATILKTENDLVVADTRRLLTDGKAQYLQGEFDRAESFLLQARSRWSTTNSTSEVEVEYWLKLVQTALSVKTGRDIPVTAPLFPEMSQLLSLAKQYYEEGSALLSKRDKTGAIRSFAQARQKISEVKVVFPLNQEARVLELRIDQLSDPDEFGRKFARMFSESKSKLDARNDLPTAYSDLQDLQTINPRYPGLGAQIERAEILLGFRLPPPDPKAVAESRSLTLAARRIFDSRQVAQFAFARAQLEKAIGLDPNNAAAGELKDRIATYIGGDTAIVLSSAAETLYNEAVTYFTNGDYINARARLARLAVVFPKGRSMQKVVDLESRLTARGY